MAKKVEKKVIDDYSALIITIDEKNLYDENYNKIGMVNKDVRLALDGKKEVDKSTIR